MSDWLARKLAERQAQQPPQPYPQQAYPPQTVAAPPGYPSNYPQTQGWQQPPQQQYQQPAPQGFPAPGEIDRTVDPNDPFGTAVRVAMAGKVEQRTSTCPECHQDTVFQPLTNENGYPLRMPPAAYCTNCGWPRMQSGSIHGGASLMKPSGPGKMARQLKDHTVEIYDSTGRVTGAYEAQPGGISRV